ncbi:MAG: GNAT family N-acetyltransferase [Terricaulis sp.]|nr:GNAT family N-acetyltransferase [Terricaulis sp.]
MNVVPLTGDKLSAALPALARLRIEVFRAFPYLYDGDLAYEEKYLSTFAQSRDAFVAAAYDGDEIIGCATSSALDTNHQELIAPLSAAGIDLASTFYNGESVLSAAYRGRGLGHAFFDHREAHARERGYARACFCAVIRPEDHARKPAGYSRLIASGTRAAIKKSPASSRIFPGKISMKRAKAKSQCSFGCAIYEHAPPRRRAISDR